MHDMNHIESADQPAFIASFWSMLNACETLAADNGDMILKIWVSQWHAQFGRLTNQKSVPAWEVRPVSHKVIASKPIQMLSVARDEQENALHSFWMLLTSLDNEIDDTVNSALKSQVKGWYEQWNGLTKDDKSPAWERRAHQAIDGGQHKSILLDRKSFVAKT